MPRTVGVITDEGESAGSLRGVAHPPGFSAFTGRGLPLVHVSDYRDNGLIAKGVSTP